MLVKTVLIITIFGLCHGTLSTEDLKTNLKIVGGQEVTPHSYPYQVGIAIREPRHRSGWCGGALISDEFVLTAVHCLKGIQFATLFIGAHDVRNISFHPNAITIDVTPRNMLLHRLWTPRHTTNDIALIRLPEPIPLSDSIQPIALPNSQTIVLPGQKLVATGWGRTSTNISIARPSKLHSVELRVEPDATCKNLFIYYEPTQNICLEGNAQKTTCFGDSGGPIVATNEKTGTKVLVGITSYGRKCENVSVLTKVAAYIDWIAFTVRRLVII